MIFRMMDNVGYILENKKKKTASLIKSYYVCIG